MVNTVSTIVSEAMDDGLSFDDDFAKILTSAAIGAVEGAVNAIIPGASMLTSTVANAADSLASDLLDTEKKTTDKIVTNAAISAGFGFLGGMGDVSFVKGNDIVNDGIKSLKKTLKGNHPSVKKTARKSKRKARKYIAINFADNLLQSLTFTTTKSFIDKFGG